MYTARRDGSRSALLYEPGSLARQETRLIPSADGQILVSTHIPDTTPVAALFICNSFAHPFAQNYRREALLGRTLSSQGVVVRRFSYRGTGESSGSPFDLTTPAMIDDASVALADFAGMSNRLPLFVLGTHWGSHVAACVASKHPGTRLILWDPVLDGQSLFRQMFRSLWATTANRVAGIGREEVLQRLNATGAADIHGYPYSLRFHTEAESRSLLEMSIAPSTEVFIVGFNKRGDVPAGLRELERRLNGQGHTVEVRHVCAAETWWVQDSGEYVSEEDSDYTKHALSHTVSWIMASAAIGDRQR